MRKMNLRSVAGAIIFTLLGACSVRSQTTLNIWPGVAPGSETWKQQERKVENTPVGTVIFNVVTPTITVFLPEKSKATGTGIIIAPGGAFVALAIDLEAYDLARYLAAKRDCGIRAEISHPGKKGGRHPRNGHGRGGEVRDCRREASHQGGSGARHRVGHFAGQSGVYWIFCRGHGRERSVVAGKCRGASEFCGVDLWRSVRCDAQHSFKTASDFHGLGAGRRSCSGGHRQIL